MLESAVGSSVSATRQFFSFVIVSSAAAPSVRFLMAVATFSGSSEGFRGVSILILIEAGGGSNFNSLLPID